MNFKRYFLAAFFAAGTAHASTLMYTITVNTSALSGDSGYLDFQFNPGDPAPSDPANAVISGFSSNGVLSSELDNSGDVSSGTLPSPITIRNTTAYNDFNEAFTFGTFFSAVVSLNVPLVSGAASSGSVFALTLYEGDDATEYLTPASPDLVEIDLDTAAQPTIVNNSPNGEAVVSAVATATPEPGAASLAALGVMALMALSGRRRG